MLYGAIKKNFEVVMTIVRIDLTSRTSIYVFDVAIKRLTHNKVCLSIWTRSLFWELFVRIHVSCAFLKKFWFHEEEAE